jgi:ankyrin repeat protein
MDFYIGENQESLFLLDYEFDINYKYKDGKTYLHHECINGNKSIVDTFIIKGIDIFIKDNIDKTALEYAFENKHIDIAKKLLDIGLKSNMDKIIELFVSCFPKGPNIHKGIDEEDETYSNTDLGIFLINNGLSPDSVIDWSEYSVFSFSFSSECCTIFGHICFTGYKRILNHMINKGATINIDFINSEDADCPLTEACCGNFSEIVSILLENGADPYRNITGCQTPLMIACTGCGDRGPWLYPNTKIIKMLVEAGANVNARSGPCHSALYWLINGYDRVFDDNIYDAIEFLLENGANVNEIDEENDNNTLLMSHPSDYRLISILIKYGPKLDLINEDGDSILHLTGDEEIVKLLIENGANCNIKNIDGDTILHNYASLLDIEMCEYIISFGGNSLEKNDDNETVFDVIGKHYDDNEPFIGPIEKDSDMSRKCKLTDEQKNYCIEILKRARQRYLDKVRRDENWERRKDLMMILIKHGFKDESYDVVKDTNAKIPGVLRNKEYLVKKIFTVPKRTVNESIKNGESCENIMSFL